MRCPNCHESIPEDAVLCPQCGQTLAPSDAAESSTDLRSFVTALDGYEAMSRRALSSVLTLIDLYTAYSSGQTLESDQLDRLRQWATALRNSDNTIAGIRNELAAIEFPPELLESHNLMLSALADHSYAIESLALALDTGDQQAANLMKSHLASAGQSLAESARQRTLVLGLSRR